ncbi:F0F1 ATP synthase subunit gamma [Candidatus Dependentiae bacterium]
MAQLIQMRQRIKAIETIKKVTHAMRLISMSMHSRLRGKTPLLKKYNNEVAKLFKKLRFLAPHWKSPITHPDSPKESNPLFILVGSQKGLCGTFNTNLLKEFEKVMPQSERKNTNFITVGKKAVDYLSGQTVKSMVGQFNEMTMRNFTEISNEIVDIIVNAKTPYSCVKILSNELKTFFFQDPRLLELIPLDNSADTESPVKTSTDAKSNVQSESNKEEDLSQAFNDGYIWYQKVEDLLDKMAPQYIASNINALLVESLLAEQAARFISMDTATRNAKNLLEETTLQYNKLRQAKITKELTELATNF